jgi:hypothetical protein
MYKVLDLRDGTFLKGSDIYWVEQDMLFISKDEAQKAINMLVNMRCFEPSGSMYSFSKPQNNLECYFQIVEA